MPNLLPPLAFFLSSEVGPDRSSTLGAKSCVLLHFSSTLPAIGHCRPPKDFLHRFTYKNDSIVVYIAFPFTYGLRAQGLQQNRLQSVKKCTRRRKRARVTYVMGHPGGNLLARWKRNKCSGLRFLIRRKLFKVDRFVYRTHMCLFPRKPT